MNNVKCACTADCSRVINVGDDVVAVHKFDGRAGSGPPSWVILSHLQAWTEAANDIDYLLAKLEGAKVVPMAADESERRTIAAYLLDRASQYREDSCCKAAIEQTATAVMRGDAADSAKHGERRRLEAVALEVE